MNSIKLLTSLAVLAVTLGVAVERADAGLFHKKCPPPTKEVILEVCHPCTGCKYEIPVCIPCCCCGAPSVCFKKTIFGYGKMTFEWECGHTVVVRFPHCGGYKVID